ncbi:MAG: hypothetical protein HGA25_10850, partial [Clostridiales bacterium]|nr:hypothetical protein [Clostridiales bacterium]
IIQCHIYITKKNLFPQEIKLLEQILDDLEEAGVVTNFQQRYSKLKVNFLETTASKEPKEDMPQHMTDIMKRLEELRKK